MEDNCTALRDIEAGEELLEDYSFWSVMKVYRRHWLIVTIKNTAQATTVFF